MNKFTPQDVANYYDQTDNHFRIWWKMNKSMGLHYGVWQKGIKNLSDAILNTNSLLMKMGEIKESDVVLDAGCGVGGSTIFLAKNLGCKVTGITLSEKQTRTASKFAEQHGVSHLVSFKMMDYTKTSFPDNTFDVVWALESMQTAVDKSEFFKEVKRILKPGGRFLISDWFKSYNYPMNEKKSMQMMNHYWAITELVTIEEFQTKTKKENFSFVQNRDATKEVAPTVRRVLVASYFGMYVSIFYNIFIKRAGYFSRNHYKTGFGQFIAYYRKLWTYNLLVLKLENK